MNHTRCRVTDESLIGYGDGYLTTDQMRDLDQHVPSCPRCQSQLREAREVRRLLQAWAPPLKAADGWPAMRARLEAASDARQLGPRLARNAAIAALVLAIFVIALVSPIGTWVGFPSLGNLVQFATAPAPSQPDQRLAVPAPSTDAVGLDNTLAQRVTIEAFDIGWAYLDQSSLPERPIAVAAVPGTTISLLNTGAIAHTFVVDALAIDVVIPPAETVTVVIPRDAAAGTHEFYCGVPGHKQAGMVGALVIE